MYGGGQAVVVRNPGSWNMQNVKYNVVGTSGAKTVGEPGSRVTGLEFGQGAPGYLREALTIGRMMPALELHKLRWIDAPTKCGWGADEADQERQIYDWVSGIKEKGARVIIVLLPRQETNAIYNAVKRVCDVRVGIHSICVRQEKLNGLRPGTEDQYWANVGLKLNLKLGGVVSSGGCGGMWWSWSFDGLMCFFPSSRTSTWPRRTSASFLRAPRWLSAST
jgi:hypothetical protein